ncbi:unnamed protein product [Darwinula stevensoni]|uniref:Uncharacterized protein n=1 Tax=Darwinula stevensoni TaxID=69355 RepID=A0A7R9A2P5_9CRUS|nr:unnamed protein product [Darwinula stevensoni]CAG0880375.1 unnamed protein product [Darwinula stevensoni]
MAWVRTFCGCISTRKGAIVIASLALTLSIPVVISLGSDFRRISAYHQDHSATLRAYRKMLIFATTLIVVYAMSSLILIFAAQKVSRRPRGPFIRSSVARSRVSPLFRGDCQLPYEGDVRMMHVPWMVVHPVVTVGLVTVMAYVAALLGRSATAANEMKAVQTVFWIFVCLWIMSYLWVVVVSNYQKLGNAQDGDDDLPADTTAWSLGKWQLPDGQLKRRSRKQNILVAPASTEP